MVQTIEKRKKPVEAVTSDFWQGKVPCWTMWHCPEVIRNECPALKHISFPCWEIEGTYRKLDDQRNDGADTSICKLCPVYKKWGQNNPIRIRLLGVGIDTSLRKDMVGSRTG